MLDASADRGNARRPTIRKNLAQRLAKSICEESLAILTFEVRRAGNGNGLGSIMVESTGGCGNKM